ncbi:MAG: cobalamin biosynthesis protein [Nitrospirota bacterium]|nr:cobalamin biosynthesis protein [Nitrospirota bacterium]
MTRYEDTAVIAITKHGVAQAARLVEQLPGAALIVPEKFAAAAGPLARSPYSGPLSAQVGGWFGRYRRLVFHVSLGAVVRLIAPHLKSKDDDPAVLVVDDAGRFVISVLSGHVGGANAFCEEVAHALGATPVITTASDVGKTIPVDILGRELGWQVDPLTKGNITRVSAAVVNEEPVAFIQQAGEPGWWTRDTPLPRSIQRFAVLAQASPEEFSAVLWVTDRELTGPFWEAVRGRCVVYRPRSLVLGVGCDKGTSRETLAEAVELALRQNGLSPLCIRNLATIDKKRDEPGLVALARELGVEVVTYPAAQLAAVPDVPNPSDVVLKYMGTPAVGEPAAMLSAGVGVAGLVVEKFKYKGADGLNATVSVARGGC